MSDKKNHRHTIAVEQSEVLLHEALPANQYVLRVLAPACASAALPGQFVHLQCDPMLPMRRPLSIMRVDAGAGWVDLLYKVVGHGTRLLATRKPGDLVSLMGPIGKPFNIDPTRTRPLLLGGGVGIPPMIFLADHMRHDAHLHPLVLMGSEVPFPFNAEPSKILMPGIPDGVIGAMPLLEEWGVPGRLASRQGYPGCFDGFITELAKVWLDTLAPENLEQVQVFACGPEPMLAASAALAQSFGLPCQLSLEEFMACAVGGCAGCTVPVHEAEGLAMRRVCVDGPVFEARSIYPAAGTA